MKLSRIDRYLTTAEGLQPLIAKALEISSLSRRCIEVLPPELGPYVRGANIREDTLVILAANPAAAAKLKLFAGTLSQSLLKQGSKVKSVSVRVQPRPAAAQFAAPHKHAILTEGALKTLAGLRDTLEDSPARRALDALLDARGARPTQKATSSRSPNRRSRNTSTTPRET
jgi:hypothetical protein